MQEPNMKSTEPESVPVLENFQENVELPAVAICENAHPVGKTPSASSFLSKQSTALHCLGFTFSITKNTLGTLKPIAAKLQKKDPDVFHAYSMIDDTIKAVARVRSNIEEECHEWFEDASRMADKIGDTVSVPRITGRQEHRNNAPSVNPESHYRVNVAIPFIDHLLEEMSSRFSEDNRDGAEIFSLVPSAVVMKHDSLRNLAEKLQFWQQGLPTPSSLLSELKEWQYFWKQYTPTLQLPGNLIECVKYADEDMYPNLRDLLIIGCTLPVSSAEAERSYSGLRRIKSYLRNRMSAKRLSGMQECKNARNIRISPNKRIAFSKENYAVSEV